MPPPAEHGRLGGGSTLWWPGGPLVSPGHGGRAFVSWLTGAGVGFGVGLAVGVGLGVGLDVGFGVGLAVGFAAVGVGRGSSVTGWGVGPSATVGADGVGDASGGVEGSGEPGVVDGVGLASGGVDAAPEDVEGVGDAAGVTIGAGVCVERATSDEGPGATAPAVSATVARMRFKSPMATTSRAR